MLGAHPREGRRLIARVFAILAAGLLLGGCRASVEVGGGSSPTPAATQPGVTLPPSETAAPTAEPPAAAALPDGRQFGYVKGVDASARTLTFDLAYFLTGAQADQAAADAGVIQPGEHVDNDYFIVNSNTKLRTVAYSPNVDVKVVDWTSCCESASVDLSTFVHAFQPGGKSDAYHGPDSQYWLTVSGGVVTKIEEQYLP